MEVRFGQHRVKNNETLSLTTAKGDLQITWPGEGLHSLLVYDLSVPQKSPFVHFWATNIPEDDLYKGTIRIPYTPPSPPEGAHTYTVELFRQSRELPRATEQLPRENFPIDAVIRSLGLIPVQRLAFQVTPGPRTRSRVANGKEDWTQGLDSVNAAYCRCVIESASKQPATCTQEKAWRQEREGRKCYNPYAVCHASVKGATRVNCGQHYIFENIPDLELIGFANLNNIPLPPEYDRQRILQAIQTWKQSN